MALHGISPHLRKNNSQEEEQVNEWLGAPGEIKIKKRVNGWLDAPEEMEVERREEVEEERGELVQTVEDLK